MGKSVNLLSNLSGSTKFVANSPQIVPINTFVNVNHMLFSAWKNQKIDRVDITNKFKGTQNKVLKNSLGLYVRYGWPP